MGANHSVALVQTAPTLPSIHSNTLQDPQGPCAHLQDLLLQALRLAGTGCCFLRSRLSALSELSGHAIHLHGLCRARLLPHAAATCRAACCWLVGGRATGLRSALLRVLRLTLHALLLAPPPPAVVLRREAPHLGGQRPLPHAPRAEPVQELLQLLWAAVHSHLPAGPAAGCRAGRRPAAAALGGFVVRDEGPAPASRLQRLPRRLFVDQRAGGGPRQGGLARSRRPAGHRVLLRAATLHTQHGRGVGSRRASVC